MERLKERNHRETSCSETFIQFSEYILHFICWNKPPPLTHPSDSSFFDTIQQLRKDNIRLSFENDRLRSETTPTTGGGSSSSSSVAEVQALEKKLLAQQEELTDLHKRKGENSQMIVDLNMKLSDLSQQLLEKEHRSSDQTATINSLSVFCQDDGLTASLNSHFHFLFQERGDPDVPHQRDRIEGLEQHAER